MVLGGLWPCHGYFQAVTMYHQRTPLRGVFCLIFIRIPGVQHSATVVFINSPCRNNAPKMLFTAVYLLHDDFNANTVLKFQELYGLILFSHIDRVAAAPAYHS